MHFKNIFSVFHLTCFYQDRIISTALACYTLTANTIKGVTRDVLDEDYLLLQIVEEKVLIWAEWAEGRKGCSGFCCSLHSLLFPASIKLPACTCSSHPTILSRLSNFKRLEAI